MLPRLQGADLDIYRHLPPLLVVLISATMPQEVLDAKLFMNERQVLVQRDELTLEGISSSL